MLWPEGVRRRQSSGVRNYRREFIIGTGVLCLLGIAVYVGLVGNPAIARMKGEVVSVERAEDPDRDLPR
jgi:hypothetical protein